MNSAVMNPAPASGLAAITEAPATAVARRSGAFARLLRDGWAMVGAAVVIPAPARVWPRSRRLPAAYAACPIPAQAGYSQVRPQIYLACTSGGPRAADGCHAR